MDWQPFDENVPKDRPILVTDGVRIDHAGFYQDELMSLWNEENLWSKTDPTHWVPVTMPEPKKGHATRRAK